MAASQGVNFGFTSTGADGLARDFKKVGDTCRWDANDTGADQCRPASGRWKKDGDSCTWSASDSGPDQCNPRQAR